MIESQKQGYKQALLDALISFKCCKDIDVQRFLNFKAIDFEKRGWASTYLILNQDCFDAGELKVEGYFSLSHKPVIFAENVSRSRRQKICGLKNSKIASFCLIGQLGKHMEMQNTGIIKKSTLTGKELLDDAIKTILNSSDYISIRNVMIECKSVDFIRRTYTSYGFIDLQYDGKLHTMYLDIHQSIDF